MDVATADGTATTADGDYDAATGTRWFAGERNETQTFAVTDQLKLKLGGALVDQVDERIDSPSVTRMNS